MKPSLFKNEILGTADPLYTILFEGLWCNSDREGRLEDRPMRLKAEIFPYREGIDLDAMLTWLASHKDGDGNPEFIIRYSVGGQKYIQIINFKKHQNPHVKESASTIPAPGLPDAEPGNTGTSRADSLNPITLTPNPSTALSGSAPDATADVKKRNYKNEAIQVLQLLNEKTKRNYRALDGNNNPTSNLRFIIDRLKSGVSLDDARSVVALMCRKWMNDDKMQEYLRPSTLFRASNFENYLGQLRSAR